MKMYEDFIDGRATGDEASELRRKAYKAFVRKFGNHFAIAELDNAQKTLAARAFFIHLYTTTVETYKVPWEKNGKRSTFPAFAARRLNKSLRANPDQLDATLIMVRDKVKAAAWQTA